MNPYAKIAALLERGVRLVVVTVVAAGGSSPARAGFKLLATENGELDGTVGGGALEHRAIEEACAAMTAGEPRLLELDLTELGMQCGGRVTLLLEPLSPARPFVVFGGGHVGRALAPLLGTLGYRVAVFDNREELRGALAALPGLEVVIGPYTDIAPVASRLPAGGGCFIATHGHEHDLAVLRQVARLEAPLSYIGMIGSKRKVQASLDRLGAEGLRPPACLFAPVGLDLGGNTPAEIAVAVAAELIAVRSGKPVPHMRLEARPS